MKKTTSSSPTGGFRNSKIIELFANSKVNYLLKVLETLPGNIYWKNAQNKFEGTNWEMAKIMHLSHPGDIIGKTNSDLFELGLAKKTDAVDLKVLKSGKTIIAEEIGLNQNGERVTYLSIKKPLQDEEGNIIGLVGNSIDISKIKEAEQREKEAKEKLEETDQLRREFIANMEHDLRTPTGGLYGLLEIMVNEEMNTEKKKMLEISRNAAKELLDVVNKILDFSNQENGSIHLQEKRFNFRKLIEHLINLENAAIMNKSLKFAFKYAADCPEEIFSDEYRIHYIILHLLSNAIKFTDHGSIEIEVKKSKIINDRKIILYVTVKDTGRGIDKKQQNIIFEKFKKLTLSNKGREKGMGIGLYIVKRFIEDLEGDIYLESEPGKGTTFSFALEVKLPLV